MPSSTGFHVCSKWCYFSFSKESYERWVEGIRCWKRQWGAEGFKPQRPLQDLASARLQSPCSHWTTWMGTIAEWSLICLCWFVTSTPISGSSSLHTIMVPFPMLTGQGTYCLEKEGSGMTLRTRKLIFRELPLLFSLLKTPNSCSCQIILTTQALYV